MSDNINAVNPAAAGERGVAPANSDRRTAFPSMRLMPHSAAALDTLVRLLPTGDGIDPPPVQVMSESEERFRQLAESLNDVFWVYEPQSPRFLYVSPAYEREWLRNAEALYADAGQWLAPVHVEDRQFLQDAFDQLAAGEGYATEYRVTTSSGDVRWILEKAFQVASQSGQVSRIAGISQDITERKTANIELLRTDRRRDEFLAMLAHELRNPLEPIRSAAAVLARLHVNGPEIEKNAVSVIERQVNHLTRLVDDLLDVARINYGKIRLRSESIRLQDVVAAAIDTTRTLAEKSRVHVRDIWPPGDVWILGDAVRLTQVFTNLLHNAIKFSETHGSVEVRIALTGMAHHVSVTIRDHGAGIAADFIGAVFDVFSQADQPPGRDQGGLGIGLSVVSRLTELHGGTVTVHSAGLGRGSEFVVSLPIITAPLTAIPSALSIPHPIGRRILLVDDNKDAAESMQALLRMEGFYVELAFSGKSALDLVLRLKPEVIILDIGLPDMSGYEVARRIRLAAHLPAPLLVAITGYGREQDLKLSCDAGFDHHLVKPADHTQLLAILSK